MRAKYDINPKTGECKVTRKEWKPKEGEMYWYVEIVNLSDSITLYHKNGNCFRTKSLAVDADKAIKRLLTSLPHA